VKGSYFHVLRIINSHTHTHKENLYSETCEKTFFKPDYFQKVDRQRRKNEYLAHTVLKTKINLSFS